MTSSGTDQTAERSISVIEEWQHEWVICRWRHDGVMTRMLFRPSFSKKIVIVCLSNEVYRVKIGAGNKKIVKHSRCMIFITPLQKLLVCFIYRFSQILHLVFEFYQLGLVKSHTSNITNKSEGDFHHKKINFTSPSVHVMSLKSMK